MTSNFPGSGTCLIIHRRKALVRVKSFVFPSQMVHFKLRLCLQSQIVQLVESLDPNVVAEIRHW